MQGPSKLSIAIEAPPWFEIPPHGYGGIEWICYWLVDGLMDKGHQIHLANTAAIQQYEGLKYTPAGLPTFCDWEYCRRATSIRKRSERYVICCASAARWCANEPPIC